MKVLIVKASALGDVVHALPVLSCLRRARRDITVHWLVEAPWAPLVENHPGVSRVHRLHTGLWRRASSLPAAWKAFGHLVARLRRERYDMALDLQGNCKSGLFTLLCGAPLRYGFDAKAVREWPNLLATNRRVSLGPQDHHITDRSLKISSTAFPQGLSQTICAKETEGDALLSVSDSASLAKVEDFLRDAGWASRKRVLIHPGTTWPTKEWSMEQWRELARGLAEDPGTGVVATWGDEGEREAAERILAPLGSGGRLWPRGTLAELLALFQRMHVVVAGDTGPLHMAAAAGTPTVSFYRATDGKRNGPRGSRHIVLQSPLSCSPCLLRQCPRDMACRRSVTVAEVLQAARRLLRARPEAAAPLPRTSPKSRPHDL